MTPGASLTIFKSEIDDVADPIAAVLIYRGVQLADGSKPEVRMVDSDLHVFTRLAGRENVQIRDYANQLAAFQEMEQEMLD
jgi:carboxylesterase